MLTLLQEVTPLLWLEQDEGQRERERWVGVEAEWATGSLRMPTVDF